METVLERASKELTSLQEGNYKAIVGDASNYLRRAKPVFENAEQVFAVSIDTVSTFWVSTKKYAQQLAKNSVDTQPVNTLPIICLFKSAERA